MINNNTNIDEKNNNNYNNKYTEHFTNNQINSKGTTTISFATHNVNSL